MTHPAYAGDACAGAPVESRNGDSDDSALQRELIRLWQNDGARCDNRERRNQANLRELEAQGLLPQLSLLDDDAAAVYKGANVKEIAQLDGLDGDVSEVRFKNGAKFQRNADKEITGIQYNNGKVASDFQYDEQHQLISFRIVDRVGEEHTYAVLNGMLTIDAGKAIEKVVKGSLQVKPDGTLLIIETGDGSGVQFKQTEIRMTGCQVESGQYGPTRVISWGGDESVYKYSDDGKLTEVKDWGRHLRLDDNGNWVTFNGIPTFETPTLEADGSITYVRKDGSYLHHTAGGTNTFGRVDSPEPGNPPGSESPPDGRPAANPPIDHPGDDQPPPANPPISDHNHLKFGAWTQPQDVGKKSYKDALPFMEDQLGRDVDIAHRFIPWDKLPDTKYVQELSDRGTETMLSFGWHAHTTDVAAGKEDEYLKAFAGRIKEVDGKVILRYGWEMDGSWSQDWMDSPESYVAAYKHVVDLFDEMGVDNVEWSWCPTIAAFRNGEAQNYWPGSEYVDWIAADGYSRKDTAWKSFEQLFDPLTEWVAVNHPDKPIMIAETGVSEKPGDPSHKANWYAEALAYMKAHPSYGAFIYFDEDQMNENDGSERAGNFSFDSTAASYEAFKRMVNDPYMMG